MWVFWFELNKSFIQINYVLLLGLKEGKLNKCFNRLEVV